MNKSRYTEQQLAYALRQAETGTAVAEVIRWMGVSEQTFYQRKKVYGGLGVGELRRVKQLEEENRKLKQLVADLSLDKHILQDVVSKKALTSKRRRDLVALVQAAYGASERRSCVALGVDRSSVGYVSVKPDQAPARLARTPPQRAFAFARQSMTNDTQNPISRRLTHRVVANTSENTVRCNSTTSPAQPPRKAVFIGGASETTHHSYQAEMGSPAMLKTSSGAVGP